MLNLLQQTCKDQVELIPSSAVVAGRSRFINNRLPQLWLAAELFINGHTFVPIL